MSNNRRSKVTYELWYYDEAMRMWDLDNVFFSEKLARNVYTKAKKHNKVQLYKCTRVQLKQKPVKLAV